MQLVHEPGGVRIAAGVHELRAPDVRAPVLPVLDDDVDGDVVVPIALLDGEELGRALVVVLRLEEAVGPLGEERRRPGGRPVVGDDLIDGRAVEEVVVDQIARLGAEAVLRVAGDVPREVGRRVVVPEETVPLVGDEDGDLDLRVGVEHVQRRALAVHDAVLVLAETEQRLVRRRVERGLNGVGAGALDGRGFEALAVLRDQEVVGEVRIADQAAALGDLRLHARRRDRQHAGRLGHTEAGRAPGRADRQRRLRWDRRGRRVRDPDDVFLAHLHPQPTWVQGERHAGRIDGVRASLRRRRRAGEPAGSARSRLAAASGGPALSGHARAAARATSPPTAGRRSAGGRPTRTVRPTATNRPAAACSTARRGRSAAPWSDPASARRAARTTASPRRRQLRSPRCRPCRLRRIRTDNPRRRAQPRRTAKHRSSPLSPWTPTARARRVCIEK